LSPSFFGGFLGRKIGTFGASLLTTTCIFFSCLGSFVAFFEVCLGGSPCYLKFYPWIEFESFFSSWGFLFDSLTIIMLLVVSFISFLVHAYSTEYMSHDPHLPRFLSFLSIFTFFMFFLVGSDNFIQMFLGWEGIGLSSYLLINFWFSRIQANKAAIKAMLMNRIGDFGLILGIFMLNLFFQSVEYSSIFAMVPLFVEKEFFFFSIRLNVINFVGALFFIGAIGKSAQLGLHCWLPDAMEGPTPVSALIHAATLVTAGVFLLARCSPIFEFAQNTLAAVTFFGAVTAFFASVTGLLQNDLKKVIAYSTCSQLGYMVFACGVSNYPVGIFHLVNHAFFKALLFLSAGSVIHGIFDEQDMRKMGGLRKILPFTYSMMIIGSFSLMGLPFLTGFYSKDLILEVAYAKFTPGSHFAFWLGTLSAFFTAFYSTRLAFLTFLCETNGFKPTIKNSKDSPFFISIPLGVLAFPSIFIGFLAKDMFVGVGSDFWSNALFIHPQNFNLFEADVIPQIFKLLPVILSFLGVFLSFFIYSSKNRFLYLVKISKFGIVLYTFLNRKWFFDKVYNEFVGQQVLFFAYFVSYKIVDKGIFEIFGPFGLSFFTSKNVARTLSLFQSGALYQHTLFFFAGFFTLLLLCGEFSCNGNLEISLLILSILLLSQKC
jgi:NADH-ubiquinone oxidoreductase chain 5